METRKLGGMVRGINALREQTQHSDMPTQMALVFLEVAMLGEIPMAELGKKVGISQASVSRLVSTLSSGRPSDPGFGLIEAYEDPGFRRRKLVRITARGRLVAQRVSDAI